MTLSSCIFHIQWTIFLMLFNATMFQELFALKNMTVHPICRKIQCPYANGWHILGSDLGCCGNYGGCCQLASIVCWAHDLFCKCCDFGVFICGPLCEKDPDCPVEEGSGEIHDTKENITGVWSTDIYSELYCAKCQRTQVQAYEAETYYVNSYGQRRAAVCFFLFNELLFLG